MLRLRFASIAMLVALLGASLLAPLGASAQETAARDELRITNSPVFDGNKRVGTFTGTVSDLAFDTDGNDLLVSGVLNGTVRGLPDGVETIRNVSFRDIVSTIDASRSCKILDLDIGRITLNLLGLVVDIAPIRIDIDAVPGPGNLLGNLLCALVGLLD